MTRKSKHKIKRELSALETQSKNSLMVRLVRNRVNETGEMIETVKDERIQL